MKKFGLKALLLSGLLCLSYQSAAYSTTLAHFQEEVADHITTESLTRAKKNKPIATIILTNEEYQVFANNSEGGVVIPWIPIPAGDLSTPMFQNVYDRTFGEVVQQYINGIHVTGTSNGLFMQCQFTFNPSDSPLINQYAQEPLSIRLAEDGDGLVEQWAQISLNPFEAFTNPTYNYNNTLGNCTGIVGIVDTTQAASGYTVPAGAFQLQISLYKKSVSN